MTTLEMSGFKNVSNITGYVCCHIYVYRVEDATELAHNNTVGESPEVKILQHRKEPTVSLYHCMIIPQLEFSMSHLVIMYKYIESNTGQI